jgi:hypothetical protein
MTGQDRLRRPVDLDWTLGDLVEHRAAEHGDRVALRSADGAVVSYSSLATAWPVSARCSPTAWGSAPGSAS